MLAAESRECGEESPHSNTPGSSPPPQPRHVCTLAHQGAHSQMGPHHHHHRSVGTLPNAKETLRAARDKGLLVAHCPITFSEGYKELAKEPYGILGK